MDEELERRYAAVDQAEREWREHRLTGFEVRYRGGAEIGTATEIPFTDEWREREAKLRDAFEAARAAWLLYLPR